VSRHAGVAALIAIALGAAPSPAAAPAAKSSASPKVAPAAPAAKPAKPARDTTSVVLLGTGMPYPDPKAQGPAVAVTVGSRLFLFDAGPGVMRQMNAAGLPVIGGPITGVFLTHLHSDHTLGLPDVILTSWVMRRAHPLPIYGPPGTAAMTRSILSAWKEDIRIRTQGLEHETAGGERVTVREIGAGVVYDSAGVKITAIRVKHGTWATAFGYRIDGPGKSIVISGDTAPCEAIEEASRGVDLLLHEVYPAARLKPEERPGGEDWPRYMQTFHTSDRELGAIAAKAKPKRLVLIHIVRMGGTDAEILAGVRAGGFHGPVSFGHDLERY
jgi:ribonuclease BN (tRNA processing enzyme)